MNKNVIIPLGIRDVDKIKNRRYECENSELLKFSLQNNQKYFNRTQNVQNRGKRSTNGKPS
jgi:hypothetical protein